MVGYASFLHRVPLVYQKSIVCVGLGLGLGLGFGLGRSWGGGGR